MYKMILKEEYKFLVINIGIKKRFCDIIMKIC